MEEYSICPGAKSATRPGQPHRDCPSCGRYEFAAPGTAPKFVRDGERLVCPVRVVGGEK